MTSKSSISTNLKLPFGLRNNNLLHISEVERGLACDCVCPACKHPLVAKKGEIVTHHFAHHKSSECEQAVETALHLAAKDIIAEARYLRIPPISFKGWVMCKSRILYFDNIELEQYIGDIRPDILIYVDTTPLMIEIVVTHDIDDDKLSKIRELGISTLSISLVDLYRTEFSMKQLKQAVLFDTSNKEWIYNRKLDERIRYNRAISEHIGIRPANLHEVLTPGIKFPHQGIVTNCPKTNYKPIALQDCLECPFCFDYQNRPNTVFVIDDALYHKIVFCLAKQASKDKVIAHSIETRSLPPNWRPLVWE